MMDYVGRKMLYSRHSCGAPHVVGPAERELCQFAVLWRPQLGRPLNAQAVPPEHKSFLFTQSRSFEMSLNIASAPILAAEPP